MRVSIPFPILLNRRSKQPIIESLKSPSRSRQPIIKSLRNASQSETADHKTPKKPEPIKTADHNTPKKPEPPKTIPGQMGCFMMHPKRSPKAPIASCGFIPLEWLRAWTESKASTTGGLQVASRRVNISLRKSRVLNGRLASVEKRSCRL